MFSIASWNIRGLNHSPKRKEVRQVVTDNNLSVCAILESHVDASGVYDMCRKIFSRWKWTSNGGLCPKGTRIILGWNDDNVDIMVLSQTDQVMHCQINTRVDNRTLFCSFVYADNYYIDRRVLWTNLVSHATFMRDKPWVVLGDFNAALNLEDHSCGGYAPNIAMREFKECVNLMEVMDVNATGLHFTWNEKPQGDDGILKKIDRIMSNIKFLDEFPGCFAIFQPYRISDHSPCVLRIPSVSRPKPKPFKFFNFLVHKEGFHDVVANGWLADLHGCAMFKFVKRLKGLKAPLRKLLFEQGNLHDRVNKIRVELDAAQQALDLDPSNVLLKEDHAHYLVAFKEASLDEERFLRQKSKIEWLDAGDSNTAYFHNLVKSRAARNRIEMVRDSHNVLHEGGDVPGAFVAHYEQFLGQSTVSGDFNTADLFVRKLGYQKAAHMVRAISDSEIKSAIFSMSDDKAPGPDGFTAAFFKKSWDIVGADFTCAIREFFLKGKLLREVNHTIIALIPKVTVPDKITDYRPISCCNVIFKCISKIIANRIKGDLGDLVNINQSAFVLGRRISDNILLTQELMRNYHRNSGPPKCAFKVDIQKAYDTVDWQFLRSTLIGFGFHHVMVDWIMTCVSTTSYSICINGSLYGWFQGKRGLRQGDPLSPYLFTLVMEVLSLMLQRRVLEDDDFYFHHRCEQQRIINLCFADDLFLFARGHLGSVQVIMDALDEFKSASGLVPSIPKSTVFFCNVSNVVKNSILHIMPFAEGELPVRYLGVPLISSRLLYRLLYRDCKILVEKLESRVNDWRNKFLSLAGRLQLVRSVLSSMHIYWASVFVLPVRIIHDLEQLMRGFLWCQGEMKKGKAKVAWDSVCTPFSEGGLGIRKLSDFNAALMVSHIWCILTRKDSLWVKWIYSYKLKDRSFWDVPCIGDMSWGWRKLLQIRPRIRKFVWYNINNGRVASMWFDNWADLCPLRDTLTVRNITRSGLSLSNTVRDLISDGVWQWPQDWYTRFPNLVSIPVPILNDGTDDELSWRDINSVSRPFSVALAWDSIRVRSVEVNWYKAVWFSHCIPRHSINLWLVVRRKLKTQDRLKQWDVGPLVDLSLLRCPLCNLVPDSHDHLFFECSYSMQVWSKVRSLCDMDTVPPRIDDILAHVIPLSNGNSCVSIIARLVLAATAYFIWMERNSRIFKKKQLSVDRLYQLLCDTIRLKLISFRFKKLSTRSSLLLDKWRVPSSRVVS